MTRDELSHALGFDVSRETFDRLEIYVAALLKWNKRINLISRKTEGQVWSRHIVDSAQIWPVAAHTEGIWADLGAGGGLPGLVIAAIAASEAPELTVTMVESDQRKSEFLRAAARSMNVRVDVLIERAEALEPLRAKVISARALAPLPALLSYAVQHLDEGVAVFLKGANSREELQAALETFTFTCEEVQSRTDPEAVILRIGKIRPI